MTQPAKAQEPSMEEILASIRRIIADDETKQTAEAAPPAAAAARVDSPRSETKPAAERPKAMDNIPPSRFAPRAVPTPSKPAAPESNSQDDIDAMLASFDGAAAEPPADDDVLELTEAMAKPAAPAASAFKTVAPEEDVEFSEPPPAPEPPQMERPESPPAAPAQPILSQSTVAAVESAFNSLATTVLSHNARTLEDLVKEMLRPMLKSWLDDNLPTLVERIVRAEIERVARGR